MRRASATCWGRFCCRCWAGHRRYAHITALRCDSVNPPLLGMERLVSEDAVRRAFDKVAEGAGVTWLQEHLDYCTRSLLAEPWILDVDTM